MRNLLERSIWTGVQSGIALLTVDGLTAFDATAVQSLAVAGVATVLAAIKVFSQGRLKALKVAREE